MTGEAEVFLSYEAVLDRLEAAARQLPGASVLHREGLAILRVGTASGSDVTDARPEIWLQGGLHACEWIGPVVVLRLIDELIRSSELRGRATWYLLPVVDAHVVAQKKNSLTPSTTVSTRLAAMVKTADWRPNSRPTAWNRGVHRDACVVAHARVIPLQVSFSVPANTVPRLPVRGRLVTMGAVADGCRSQVHDWR